MHSQQLLHIQEKKVKQIGFKKMPHDWQECK